MHELTYDPSLEDDVYGSLNTLGISDVKLQFGGSPTHSLEHDYIQSLPTRNQSMWPRILFVVIRYTGSVLGLNVVHLYLRLIRSRSQHCT